jgi:hypothetical protein
MTRVATQVRLRVATLGRNQAQSRVRNWVSKSSSRPPSAFWCLKDKMIKELMTFAKCETGKMSYKLH